MRYMSFLGGHTLNISNGITLLGLTKNLKKLKKELQTIFKRRNTRSNLTNNRIVQVSTLVATILCSISSSIISVESEHQRHMRVLLDSTISS